MANVGVDLSLTEVVAEQRNGSATTPTNKRPSDFTIDDGDENGTAASTPVSSSPPKEAFAVAPPPVMSEE